MQPFVTLRQLSQTPDAEIRRLGWNWMVGEDTLRYLANEVVQVAHHEAEAYYDAVNELYDMYVEAAQYMIDNNLFRQAGIGAEMEELIRFSWEDDSLLHLYGRFDLSGGLNGSEIKLIEFNADTATCIPETGIVQWAHLIANRLGQADQFNTLFESLCDNFSRWRRLNADLDPTLLISGLKGFPEDDTNLLILGEAAMEAGFEVNYADIDDVTFSPEEGIFSGNDESGYLQHNFWFKLVPWEFIADDEPDLLQVLKPIILNRKAVIANPPYTLLFQSKAILKVLWDLYPYHPLLLETSDQPLTHLDYYVEKVLFGREGENVRILNNRQEVIVEKPGHYGAYPKIYQAFTEFIRDTEGNFYQPGVFFAFEGAGLGFRRGGRIIDNTAQFIGHIVQG